MDDDRSDSDSGPAKAFLIMPIVLPLADLIGATGQTAVLAYIFGDGFSNLAYPTNPILLISLGLTVVSYPKWIRWTAKLWLWVLLVTVAFLGIVVAIHLRHSNGLTLPSIVSGLPRAFPPRT